MLMIVIQATIIRLLEFHFTVVETLNLCYDNCVKFTEKDPSPEDPYIFPPNVRVDL